MTKEIIINADDLGYTERINNGICDAYDDGVLSSTSLMANGYALRDAVEALNNRPGLGRGIHVTLTGLRPISKPTKVGSLLRTGGMFYASGQEFFARYIFGDIHLNHIETEVRNQIEKALEFIEPDHINSHMHVHMLPSVFELFCDLAEEYAIPFVRLSNEPFPLNRKAFHSGYLKSMANPNAIKQAVLYPLSVVNHRSERIATDAFSGVNHMGKMNSDILKQFIRSNEESPVELCVHPGYYDPQLDDTDEALNRRREIDLRGLTDDSVATVLRPSYELIRFADLHRRSDG